MDNKKKVTKTQERKPDAEVKVMLDRERTLIIDLNTMEKFEEIIGEGVQFNGCWKHTKAMIWAGLLDEDPELTLYQAGKLVPLKIFPKVAKALAEAFDIPDPLVEKSPGSKSGPSGDTV